jgi:error-prone DNA polymerase
MTRNSIAPQAQEDIVLSITSFALYGFPESHAASFALIAYASAYLKCHYLAAFTAALLNNQPMGFYSPATIVKDAQRHGLRVLPVDVTKSDWNCTLEETATSAPQSGRSLVARRSSVVGPYSDDSEQPQLPQPQPRDRRISLAQAPSASLWVNSSPGEATNENPESRRDGAKPHSTIVLRLGLRYVKGLHEEAGQAIVWERNREPFASIHDLARRVPELRKDELNTLSAIGALNAISAWRHGDTEQNRIFSDQVVTRSLNDPITRSPDDTIVSLPPCLRGEKIFHRRDALWSASAAANPPGPLLEKISQPDQPSPLKTMTDEERLVADFRGTGLTTGPHPMSYHRQRLNQLGVRRAVDLPNLPNGRSVRVAGCVIARQRPGTAKGFVFLSLEDETGVSNAIITPDLFQKNRLLLASEQFLLMEGKLQNQDGVISVKAARVTPIRITRAQTASHDFH